MRFPDMPLHGPAASRKAAALGITLGLLAAGAAVWAQSSLPERPAASAKPELRPPATPEELLKAHGLHQIESVVEGHIYFNFRGNDRTAAETALKTLGYSGIVWHNEHPAGVWVDTREPSRGR